MSQYHPTDPPQFSCLRCGFVSPQFAVLVAHAKAVHGVTGAVVGTPKPLSAYAPRPKP